MPKPKPLRPGDTVAFVTPASPIDKEQVAKSQALLEMAGYKVRLGKHVFDRDSYLAGSDQDRADDLHEMFLDPEVAAVYCTRGGYGCARLLPFLDLDAIAASAKIFIGFSDITTLSLALNRRGLPTLHGPMALTLNWDREPWVYESFLSALAGDLVIPRAAPRGETVIKGIAAGISTGGCLCLLADSLQTPEGLDTEGKILFIEDVDEAPHRVDAMLTHLRNAGLLQKAAGLVFGEMTRTDEKADAGIGAKSWVEIVKERVSDLAIPTIINFPFGHCPAMVTFALGIEVCLDADAGTIAFLEPFCA